MQNIFKAESRRFLSLIGMIAFVAIVGLSSVSCVINMPDDTPNHSLNGTWNMAGFTVRISGDTGTFSKLQRSGMAAYWQSAYDQGKIWVGQTAFRYLESTGYLKWDGEAIYVNYNTSTNYANYIGYDDCTIRMAEDGKTFTYGSNTWTRQ